MDELYELNYYNENFPLLMILAKKKYDSINPDLIIRDRIKNKELSSLLVIVPTNRKSRSLKKEFIYASGGKVTGKINIETLGTFSQKIYTELNPLPIRFLSEAAAAVLLKKCFSSAKLNYFNQYKSEIPSGTLSRIKNIISEYKRHGVSPDHLYDESKKLEGSEKLKASDIALIYEMYNEECKKSNSGEIGDIYEGILNHTQSVFTEKFREIFPGVNLVIINGFDEFTVPEVEIINMISGSAELLLSFDYNDNNPGIFLHLKESFRLLKSRGFINIDSPPEDKKNYFRELIRNEYFSGSTKINPGEFNVTEIAALDKEREVELIAKEIKELITSGSAVPNKICVVFNLIQNYSPVIRDKFALYGIPYNLTDRIPLSASGPVTSIITLLEIIENNYYYKSIFRALSSGFIKIRNIFLSDLMISASDRKIISGYDNWVESLKEVIPLAENNKSFSYSRALESIYSLNKILSPLTGKLSIPEFFRNFYNITDSLNITRNILSMHGDTEFYIRALSSFLNVIDELFQLLLSEYGKEKTFPLSFFLEQIRTAADNSRFNIMEKPGYGVQITNLNEIRGLNYDYLFVGGMTDGELPTRYTPEIFYSGSYLREEWKHQVEERYRFYQSLCTWEKGLYLTRALQDETKDLVPSNFLSELKNHFKLKFKSESDYSGTIYNVEELQNYAGQHINNPEVFEKAEMPNPENIRKILNVNEERKNPDAVSAYNGYIYDALPDELKGRLKKNAAKEFSASQLEVYAKCPFKYFLERILYLNIPEEPTEEMESLELGIMIHVILYRFYKKITSLKIVLFDCTDEKFKQAEEIMFRTAGEVIDEMAGKSPLNFLEIEKLKGLNGDRKKSVLYNFLLWERENNDSYIPFDFEVSFGNIKGEESSGNPVVEINPGGIRVRGKIDRIDIDNKNSRLRVIDYKLSGKKPVMDDLVKGLSLQLPLYLYAASIIIKEVLKKEYDPAGADIYSLKYQKKSFGRKSIISERNISGEKLVEEYNRIINICMDSIVKYADNISKGIFPLTRIENRENKACLYCKLNFICRVEEIY